MTSDDCLCHFDMLEMTHNALICPTKKTNHCLIIGRLEILKKMVKNSLREVIIEKLDNRYCHTGDVYL
jgi:hypothetical protein